jgi:DNA invertase Pin-like site-specific DNA recombinase
MKKYIAYYRVSTQKQGLSGLGLQSQKLTVNNFIGDNELIEEYTEIETGKNDKRIELQKAISTAKKNNATLIIAKLDRLSRNASFILALRDSNINFVCCDMPDANNFTIGIFALLAQQERELISDRTKKALQSKKDNGFKLGSPKNLTDKSRQKSIEVRKQNASENENNIKAFGFIQSLKTQNLSLQQIANKLNEFGFTTSKGKTFHKVTVQRLYNNFNQ